MKNYNNNWLIDQYRSGNKPELLFFWGARPNQDGNIGKSCLSQWWQAPFTVADITYPTAEHWMMAEKARLFKDDKTLGQIIQAETPDKVKKLGRLIKNFNAAIWDQHKFDIVVSGNIHKFSQHTALQNFLLSTKEAVLIEASPLDRIWGIGLGESNPAAQNPAEWQGLNLLGYALMQVRDKLSKKI